MIRFAVLVAVTVTAAAVLHSAHASGLSSLQASIRVEVRAVEKSKTTLRWFERHARLLYAKNPRTKARAWHVVAVARERVIKGRARLVVLRARLRAVQPIPHLKEWLCIHAGEGSWTDPDAPYWGGLQMDREFMRTYAPWLYRSKGTADHWTPREQMLVAERAWRTRGFWPWPQTARACGLLP